MDFEYLTFRNAGQVGSLGKEELKGKVSGGDGITIVGGPGPLQGGFDGIYLSNTRNDFRGPVTINGGSVCAVQDNSPEFVSKAEVGIQSSK